MLNKSRRAFSLELHQTKLHLNETRAWTLSFVARMHSIYMYLYMCNVQHTKWAHAVFNVSDAVWAWLHFDNLTKKNKHYSNLNANLEQNPETNENWEGTHFFCGCFRPTQRKSHLQRASKCSALSSTLSSSYKCIYIYI